MKTGGVKLEVYRQKECGAAGTYEKYEVPYKEGATIYDLLLQIQQNIDGDLAIPNFRCGRGICTSCLLTINGKPCLACRTPVETAIQQDNFIKIGPPPKRIVIKDLVAD
jgi:succinate dehydrogenase/fumarate reductase-like Fe-S protein